MVNFDQLPSKIILLIIRQLSQHQIRQCNLINKHLYRTINPLLWHSPYLKNIESFDAFNSAIGNATSCHLGQHIRSLTLDHYEDAYYNDALLIPWMKHLETFTQYGSFGVTYSCFQQFVAHCPRLIGLKVVGASCLTRRYLSVLNQHYSQQLQHVTLYGAVTLSCTVFSALADCTLLKTLDITFDLMFDEVNGYLGDVYEFEDWRCFIPEDWVGLDDSAVAVAMLDLAGFKHLETLRLWYPSQRFSYLLLAPNLKDRDGNTPWPQLTTLEIEYHELTHHNNNNIHVSNLIRTHPKLHTLHFDNVSLSDEFFHTLWTCLPNLRSLYLHGCNDITKDGVRRLAQQCHSIENIRVASPLLMADDFPEATRECRSINYANLLACSLDDIDDLYDSSTLEYLDHDAIKKIRQNAGVE